MPNFHRTPRLAALTALGALLATGLLACTPGNTLTRAEGDALKAEVAGLQQRVKQLESSVQALSSRAANPSAPTVSLPDTSDPARRLGRAEAPVVIVEFSDLQCPYCRRFDQQTLPWLKREYLDTGKVRFESRDYPLDFHAQAMAASLLAHCAAREGKFWEFREAIFGVQASLPTDGLDQAAATIGLDATKRAACAKDEAAVSQAIEAEKALGQSIGVQGTPSFLIGRVVNGKVEGTVLVGAGLPETFRKRLEPLLAAPTR